MFGVIKSLFSPGDISKGIDAAVYTNEEKADNFKSLLGLYEPFKKAQRLLALTLSLPFVFIHLLAAFVWSVSSFFDPCLAESVCKASQLVSTATDLSTWNNETLGTPVALILGFYFGGGAVEGVARSIVNRKKD